MNRHLTLLLKCLQLVAISTLISARIVPNYYATATKKQDEASLTVPQQFENKPKWQFNNLSSEETSEIEKLVKQSLENIFKNEELSKDNAGGYGLKTSAVQSSESESESEQKDINQELHLSDPYVLKIPVPQPYPVHIPVKQPFTVPIFKLVPEEVERKVPIQVEKLVPVYKEKPVKIIVEKHHPYMVYKPYPVPVNVNTHVLLGKKREPIKWY